MPIDTSSFFQNTNPYGSLSSPPGGYGGNFGSSGSGGSGSPNPMYGLGGGMLGAGAGALMSQLFGNQQDPAGAANQYLNQIPGAVSPYYQPYMQAGTQALGNLQGQYSNLLSDPGGMLNKMGMSYHQSPGFQFALQQAMQGAGHSAAAGGMAGSPMAQQQSQQIGTQLGNQDYYNWLDKARSMYGAGLQGEQGMAGGGLEAGTNMARLIQAQMGMQAALAYQQAQAKNKAQGDIWGDIGGGLGAIAGAYFGGPGGAAAGWQAGKNL